MRQDDDADRLIDVLLCEVAGGERPPDLTGRILAKAFPRKAGGDSLTARPREVYKTSGARSGSMSESINIPGYELMETIGAGSSGTVYKARQVSMDRLVAIKILPQKLSQDERFTQRFTREARAVAKLNHPNVVTGIDVGEVGGVYYFVMEYVDGESVAARVGREGNIAEEEALEITRQVALALDCAYRNGIVHRDIKPANILLTHGGEAKLADLGVARHAQTGGVATRRVFGTPYYMSPEQARGDADIDIRSDMYSLGATLYHLLGGKPPFHGQPPKVVMSKQISETPEDLKKLSPHVSGPAAELVACMMEKNPDDRPETPIDLIEEVKRVQRGRMPSVVSASRRAKARSATAPPPRPRHHAEAARPSRGGHGQVLAAAAAFLVVLGGGLLLALSMGGEEREGERRRSATHRRAPSAAPAPKPATPEIKVDVQGAREKLAREALAAIRRQELEPGAEIEALGKIITDHAGTNAAARAASRIQSLRVRIKAAKLAVMKKEVKKLRSQADELVATGEFGMAAAVLKGEMGDGPDRSLKQSLLARELEDIRHLAELKIVRAGSAARQLSSQGDYAKAREELKAIRVEGIEDLPERVALALAEVDEIEKRLAKAKADKARAEADKAYAELSEGVNAALAAFKPEEADRLLNAARRDPKLKPLATFVKEDSEHVVYFSDVLLAATEGITSFKGRQRTFRMRDGSSMTGKVRGIVQGKIEIESRARGISSGGLIVPLNIPKLSDAEIVKMAMSSLDKDAGETYLKTAVVYAVGDNADAAEAELAKAEKLGEDTSSVVRRWLAGLAEQRAAKLLAEARKLHKELKRATNQAQEAKIKAEMAKPLLELRNRFSHTEVYKKNFASKKKPPAAAPAAMASLSQGLVGHWAFDKVVTRGESRYVRDLSGRDNYGRIRGARLAKGKIGAALRFDGEDAYVNLGNRTTLQVTGSQTITMWLCPATLGKRQNPYAKCYGGEGTLTLETNGTVNYFYGTSGRDDDPYQTFNMSTPLHAGSWTHLAIVRDLTNMRLTWYRNGVATNTARAKYERARASELPAYIGKGYVENFEGLLDDVRIYKRALSTAEVKALASAGAVAAGPQIPPDARKFGGHWYKHYRMRGTTWHEAKRFCEERGGHLVTIASEEENGFVVGLLRREERKWAWIGLSDERVEGTFEWVTGEAVTFKAWLETQPDNGRGQEDYVHIYDAHGRWNDQSGAREVARAIIGFICEWDTGAPGAQTGLPPDAVKFGGHWYKLFRERRAWQAAQDHCQSLGGHLITITSAEEQEFAARLARRAERDVWIGIMAVGEERNWRWVTGEEFTYKGWAPGDPSRERVEDRARMSPGSNFRWRDRRQSSELTYICEWDKAPGGGAAAPGGLSRGLVAHWALDEKEGEVVRDSSGRGVKGVVRGAKRTQGRTGRALKFDGVNDYVRFGPVGISGSAPRTISGWVRAATTKQSKWSGAFGFAPEERGEEAKNRSFNIVVDEWGRYAVNVWGSSWDLCPVDINWHHFAATYDGTTIVGYLDGSPRITQAKAIATRDEVKMGLNSGRYFKGTIDDFRIYNRALSGGEVRALASGRTAAAGGIPPDALAFGTSRYKLYSEHLPWHEAKSFCEQLGGHLVTITSEQENIFVTTLARTAKGSTWLGITDEREEGTWEWVTGEPVTFKGWAPGEPNNQGGVQDWAFIYHGAGHTWHDVQRERAEALNFICEWDTVKTAAPAPAVAGAPGLAKGLLAHWKFDGGTGAVARDSSGGGKHGIITGAKPAKGRIGAALALDGVDDHVNTTLKVNQAKGSPGATYAVWVNPGSVSVSRHQLICPDDGGFDWSLLRVGGIWHVFNGQTVRSTGQAVDMGKWQHVAVAFDPAAGNVRFYKNGVEVVIPGLGYDASDGTIAIGHNPSPLFREFFKGTVDDVRIYQRPLSAAEIRTLAGAGAGEGRTETPRAPAPKAAGGARGLLGHWTFDHDEAPVVRDSSGMGNDGRIRPPKSSKRAEKKGRPRPGAKRVEGAFGRGLQLDAGTSVVMSGLQGPKAAFSVAFWLKPMAMAKHGVHIDGGRGFSEKKKGGQFCLLVVRGGSVHCGTDAPTRFTPEELGLGTVELGKWQHLAYTHDGTVGRFYKNGKLLGTKNQTPPKPWLLFSVTGLHGTIDDLRVYGRALAAEEVRRLVVPR